MLGLLGDLTDGVEPSFLRTLLEPDVDHVPVLELPELELDHTEPVLPELFVLEPPVELDPLETDPFELNVPVRSLVVGFFSSEEEEDDVELLPEVAYPL